jgi:hypothetical protein
MPLVRTVLIHLLVFAVISIKAPRGGFFLLIPAPLIYLRLGQACYLGHPNNSVLVPASFFAIKFLLKQFKLGIAFALPFTHIFLIV